MFSPWNVDIMFRIKPRHVGTESAGNEAQDVTSHHYYKSKMKLTEDVAVECDVTSPVKLKVKLPKDALFQSTTPIYRVVA